jgi:chemotaxis protein methyltransferase CheR
MIQIRESEFKELVGYLKSNFGINLEHKKKLIEGRLGNYIQEQGYSEFGEYFENLLADDFHSGLSNLVNRLTTNHTFFMREESHFEYLRDKALPEITKASRDKDLRIWSAGCSSGEEPYTIAMLLQDYFGPEKVLWDSKILATDISSKVLDKAKKAVYSAESAEPLPKHWKTRYFRKLDDGEYEISERIKNEVIFRLFNLMQEIFPFKKKFHIIFCRNVMIYFDNETKRELVKRFFEYTEPGGYLFIGHSESIGREDTGYSYVKPAIYRKM